MITQTEIKVGNFTIDELHTVVDLLFFCQCERHAGFYALIYWEVRHNYHHPKET